MTTPVGETPAWALSLAFWLHMLATVVWIGGLAALVLFVLPTARGNLDANAYATLLEKVQRRLDPLGWLSLMVLTGTGLFQMSANPNYQGFLSIANRWATAILAKHLVFISMIGISAYLTWGVMPAVQRMAFLRARGHETPGAERLLAREVQLLHLNLILGIIVLGLTAVARSS
ncbi:MAG TPA: CopD family protein [Anaerolineales bacterium]|nr:CopD family protein [Anaerolineales bacterium]